ncbi:nuclear speckle RNA-binding protein A [Panicum miliaceum]|uniref:Nuclear speckle RNA-binding protein A n=1 Tax=Panicum miliaceum TaxID=4540 RepID=A0A3L6S2R4_PANMI|nr:nuclear speckle RNA-binding protein A [Panicum miliaceum]
MADAFWRYAAADPRQQQQPPPSAAAGAGAHPGMGGAPQMAPAGGQQPMKRPRPADFSDGPGAPDMTGYYPRDEERAGYRAARDTEALNASYERFLRTGQIQSYGAGPAGEPIRPAVGGNAGYPVDERSMMAARGDIMYDTPPSFCYWPFTFPSDIFRPFVGFREVRLVNKEPKHPGGDPIVLCFVDFAEATQAAIAMDALQGCRDCCGLGGRMEDRSALSFPRRRSASTASVDPRSKELEARPWLMGDQRRLHLLRLTSKPLCDGVSSDLWAAAAGSGDFRW